MLLSEAEAKLTAVLRSLHDTPRTTYEAENLFQLNRERIDAVRAALADMSGAYVDQLRLKCNDMEQAAQARHAAALAAAATATAAGDAFSLDFAAEDGEGRTEAEMEAEMESAMAAAAGGGRRPKKSKKGKEVEKSRPKKEKRIVEEAPPVTTTFPGAGAAAATAADTPSPPPQPRWRVLCREDDVAGRDMPPALSTSGRGRCEAVPNTPLARVYFTDEVEWDGAPCRRAVELYRCVVVAMSYGEPPLTLAECERRTPARAAASPAQQCDTAGRSAAAASAGVSGEPDLVAAAAESSSDVDGDDGDGAGDMTLSEQLIAEYDQAKQTEEEEDQQGSTSALPRDVPERLQQRLRGFTDAVWVIVLCHGGYFAGGVFARGVCVVHKAFQRYVVRKKQGGKQSSNAKDAGSYNSVGSQIRAAQEVKWRIDVRDILLEWTPYVQAASVILYAAPGPQNRSVLTDFSLLPTAAAVDGSKGVSPIHVKDPRVSRVPLTSHRPTFEEVQRIYGICSRCSLLHVKEEEEVGVGA
ncbi:hypothetical protein NESM_000152500 [Novymonas esmeraldas]|uniref:VLRF1 domain-containing protein n=1 Tax=Novymonas esmeraldas TaxID=1808958 RepID=A0AAW0F6B6_9TRYP